MTAEQTEGFLPRPYLPAGHEGLPTPALISQRGSTRLDQGRAGAAPGCGCHPGLLQGGRRDQQGLVSGAALRLAITKDLLKSSQLACEANVIFPSQVRKLRPRKTKQLLGVLQRVWGTGRV